MPTPTRQSSQPTTEGLMMWRQRVFLFLVIILVTYMIFTSNNSVPAIPKLRRQDSDQTKALLIKEYHTRHIPREPDERETKDEREEKFKPKWVVDNANEIQEEPDFNIQKDEEYQLEFYLGGYVFNEKGRSKEISVKVSSSMIHNFSPYIERETEKRFVDPARGNIYYANSPAVVWHHGEIVLISRVWLDREIYEPKDNWPANHFADNWLYTQNFDKHLKPTNPGAIMGIPLPKQWWVGDGPIEPRLIVYKDKVLMTFNAAMAYGNDKFMDFTIMWDCKEQVPIIPKIKGGSPMINATAKGDMPRDKHWMALVENDKLFFVHNLDPLRVMECDLDGYCEFIHNEINKDGFIFNDNISHLRGGTPFEHYEGNYFISIAHVTLYKKKGGRYYTANLVVLCTDPYKIVYVSNDIKIHPTLYDKIPMVRAKYIKDGFFFPVGLIIENKDTITIGGHINDHSSVLIRVRGVETLMRTIIDTADQQASKSGPPVHYLQKHVHEVLQNLTHIEFVH